MVRAAPKERVSALLRGWRMAFVLNADGCWRAAQAKRSGQT
jgi:hypothetical protein